MGAEVRLSDPCDPRKLFITVLGFIATYCLLSAAGYYPVGGGACWSIIMFVVCHASSWQCHDAHVADVRRGIVRYHGMAVN
jgi:hypothetical protein